MKQREKHVALSDDNHVNYMSEGTDFRIPEPIPFTCEVTTKLVPFARSILSSKWTMRKIPPVQAMIIQHPRMP